MALYSSHYSQWYTAHSLLWHAETGRICHLARVSPVWKERGRGDVADKTSGRPVPAEPRDSRTRLGRSGERLAAAWLEARGYAITARNWHCSYGELDLIAHDRDEIVFVEVKTRRGTRMGAPEEAITRVKRRRLVASALAYLAEQSAEERPYRIDVIAVDLAPSGKLLAVRHFPRCVEMEE